MKLDSSAPALGAVDHAAEWFARKRSGAMTAQELRELQVWLDESVENTDAFRRIARAWDVSKLVDTDPEMLAIREAARRDRPARTRLKLVMASVAGAAALSVAAWLTVTSSWFVDLVTPVWQQDFHTRVGERTTVTLPDGSVLTLDTDTALHVREGGSERLVELLQGQALFRVAKDSARPFVVTANGNSVTATGTKFDVRVDPSLFKVTLLEGRVRVQTPPTTSAPGERADLVAGWQFVASKNDWSVDPIGPMAEARETAWLDGRIAVIAAPLGAVVQELNRYTVKKIMISAGLAEKPIDGVFRTGDIDGFVRLLESYRLARVVADTGGEIVLDMPKKSGRGSTRRLHGF